MPEIPDQREFLDRWNEFHQGYRVAKLQDGTEQRMPVIGEPFKEVSPGFLPRTLDQLRAGVANDAQREENRLRRERLASEEEAQTQPQRSLESAMDDLLAEVEAEGLPLDSETPSVGTAQPTEVAAPQSQPMSRIEARDQRRREQFARTFGTREELQQEDYESPLSTIFNRADDRYRQAEERRATDTTAPPPLDGLSAQERREIEEQLLWGVMRDSAEHLELEAEDNVWSYTPRREQANGDSESSSRPRVLISQRLTPRPSRADHDSSTHPDAEELLRAQEEALRRIAFRQHLSRSPGPEHNPSANPVSGRHEFPGEEALRALRSRNLSRALAPSSSDNRSASPTSRTRPSRSPMTSGPLFHFGTPRTSTQNRILGTPRTTTQNRNDDLDHLRRQFELIGDSEHDLERQYNANRPTSSQGNGMSQVQTSISQITSELQRLRLATDAIASARARYIPEDHTLDSQPDRPEPLTDEEMTKTLACQVCYQQLADVALLPCGHMCMCQWCADVVVPVKHSHVPVRPTKCPMCRKGVKQRFRIHI